MGVINGSTYTVKVSPLDVFITAFSNAMRKRGAMAFAYFNELKKLIRAPAEEHAEEEEDEELTGENEMVGTKWWIYEMVDK